MNLPDKEIRRFLMVNGYGTTDYGVKVAYDDVECAQGHKGLGMLLSVAGVTVGAFYCASCRKIDEY